MRAAKKGNEHPMHKKMETNLIGPHISKSLVEFQPLAADARSIMLD